MYVIKLKPNYFRVLSEGREYGQYIGYSTNMGGSIFATNAYPVKFDSMEAAMALRTKYFHQSPCLQDSQIKEHTL